MCVLGRGDVSGRFRGPHFWRATPSATQAAVGQVERWEKVILGQGSGLRVCGVFREQRVQLKHKAPMRRDAAMNVAIIPIFPEETEFKNNTEQNKTKFHGTGNHQMSRSYLEIYFL